MLAMGASFYFLALSFKNIPVGTAYARVLNQDRRCGIIPCADPHDVDLSYSIRRSASALLFDEEPGHGGRASLRGGLRSWQAERGWATSPADAATGGELSLYISAIVGSTPTDELTVMEFRRATPEDVPAILAVQVANFIGNLDEAERQDGFLSVEFTRKQLEEMADNVGIIVASDGARLAGYLCASSCEFNRPFPLLASMMQQCDEIDYGGRPLASSRLFIYGPVCIDRSYRGRGLLRGLYETLKKEVAGRYDVGVAFVAGDNPHSLRAHVDGLGMDLVGEFVFSAKRYHLLAFHAPGDAAQLRTQNHAAS